MTRTYDVIVAGAGPSGSAAAIAAARAGARVLLIEQTYSLGGMWTSGFVNPLFDHANKTGLLAELIRDLDAKGAWGGFWDESFQYEYMKTLLEQKCLEAGVELLYDTRCVGVETESGRVTGVTVQNIEGQTTYHAAVVIDATGDASVAAAAGAEWEIGEGGDPHTCQSMTLMFLLGGIPEKYRDGFMMYEAVEKAFERQGRGQHLCFDRPYFIPAPNADYAVVQLTHIYGCSPLSAADRTRAAVDGRRQMMAVFEALRDYDPDFAGLTLIASAPLLGIRESRRIVGEYTLTREDVLSGAQFPDGVATVTFGVDIHASNSEVQECHSVRPYQIPYRCMIPKGIEGLLVAGKTISGSHFAMASYRVTGNCCAMGEAAGKAAAYAAQNRCSVRDVPDAVVAESAGIA